MEPRPASVAVSSQYRPSIPIDDRMQEYVESPDVKPLLEAEDRAMVAKRVLKTTPPASNIDEPEAGPFRVRIPSPDPTR